MTSKDVLYDLAIEINFLIDEAQAIISSCSLDEEQTSQLKILVANSSDLYQSYRDALEADGSQINEMMEQAPREIDKLSQAIEQWSNQVKHAELLAAINLCIEDLNQFKSQAQDILGEGDLPAFYRPGLEDMILDLGERIDEYSILSGKPAIDAVQALGEFNTETVIFSDSLAKYKTLADSEERSEE